MYQHFVAYAYATGISQGFGNRVVNSGHQILSKEDIEQIQIMILLDFDACSIISTQLLRGE